MKIADGLTEEILKIILFSELFFKSSVHYSILRKIWDEFLSI